MAEKNFNVKILNRIDTLANWDSQNPKPKLGEICIAVLDETNPDTGKVTRSFKMKIGDGANSWDALPFVYYTQPEINELIVQDGASAAKVSFNSDKFTSRNVASALNELYGLVTGIKTEITDLNNEAYEIQYSSIHSNLINLTNLQQFADWTYDQFKNMTIRLSDVVFDPIATGLEDEAGTPIVDSQIAFNMLYEMTAKSASDLKYSNTLSGMNATNVQAAIDELLDNINTLEADAIAYKNDPDETLLTNLQDVVDEIYDKITDIYKFGVSKELTSFKYDNRRTQIQVDDSDPIIHDELNAQQAIEYCITKFTNVVQNLAGAVSVTFDHTNTAIITGTDVQVALEQLDAKVKDNGDRLDNLTASDVDYVNTISKLIATDVQAAIDEIYKTSKDDDKNLSDRLDAVEAWKAKDIPYIDTLSSLGETNVQKAIEKLDSRLDTVEGWDADDIKYDDTQSSLTNKDVQSAINTLAGTKDIVDTFDGDTLKQFSTNADGDLMFGTTLIGGTDSNFHKYASEISYNNATSGMTATDVQAAIDEIDSTLDGLVLDADNINYDNSTSKMAATQVQAALDEVDKRLDDLSANDVAYTTKTGAASNVKTQLDAILNWTAADLSYDDTTSALGKTTVQGAIEALDKRLDDADANKNTAGDISYDDTTSQLGTGIDNVQKAIEAIDSKVDTLELKAEKITYDDTTSAMGGTTNTVQKAVEKLDSRLDTIEGWKSDDIKFTKNTSTLTSTNVRDAIEEVQANLSTIADNKNTAGDIAYDNVNGKITDSKVDDVQEAIDFLAAKIGATDGKLTNDAKDITYTNTTSGMKATNVQGAIDELKADFGTIELKAEKVSFDTTGNNLTKTDVQEAIEEVNSKLDTIAANKNTGIDIVYSNENTGLSAANVQDAIDVLYNSIPSNADEINYNPYSGSTVTDTNVSDVIDTLVKRTDKIPTKIEELSYDNTKKNKLKATNGQAAIDELAEGFDGIKDGTVPIPYDNQFNTLIATTVQDAIDELDNKYQSFTGSKAAYVEYDNTTSGRTGVTTAQGAIDKAFSEIDQLTAQIYDNATQIHYDNDDYTSYDTVAKALDALLKKTFYIAPQIKSFSAVPAPGNYEVGYNIPSITFTWSNNKDVETQLLTGCSVTATDTTATYSTGVNSNKSFTLYIEDKDGNSDSKTLSYNFYPKVYYGAAAEPATYDSAFITGLSNGDIKQNQKGTYNINAAAGKYAYIAVPISYGGFSKVKIGGFDTDVLLCGTIAVTNANSNTQNYYLYRTTNPGLGSIAMVVE